MTTASMRSLGEALRYRDADASATYDKWAESDQSAVELGRKRPRAAS